MNAVSITLGGYQPPSSVHNRAAEVLKQQLTRRLGDAVAFEIHGNMPESHGYKAIDLLGLVEKGDLTMCYFAGSYLADRVPEVALFDLPFLVSSREQAYAALDGKLGQYLSAQFLEKTGFRVLAFWDNGFRHFTNGVRAIRSPDDCEGLSMRSMNSELHQEFFRLLGMKPTFVDVRDLVEAAKSGRLDAQENPLTNTYNFGTHHYHRHITLTKHYFGISLLLCNQAIYASWPDEVKQAVEESVKIATQAQRRFAGAEDDDILAKLDPAENEVVHLSKEERARFEKTVASLLAKQRKILGDELFALIGQ